MQLMRLGPKGAEQPAVRASDGTVYDLSGVTDDIDGRFWADDGMNRVRAALDAGRLGRLEADGMRVGAAVAAPARSSASGRTTPRTPPRRGIPRPRNR